MKQVTGVVALVLGLSVSMVSTAHATPVQAPDNATESSTSVSPDQNRGKKCATRREYKRVKVKGKRRHRSSRREVRRIMDFNGKRKPGSLVHSDGHKWETRKYRHCGVKVPHKNHFVHVLYRDNVAYAKVGKP